MVDTAVVRYDLQAGLLGASLAAGDSTINLGAVPSFPTLSNTNRGDYVPITLINATSLGGSEIVYMTGYTQGNSTGQIDRGQESLLGAGPATSWPSGASWEHGPTAVDMQGPQGWLLGGNTSGTLATLSVGTVTLAGGNNITLSQSSNAITISARQNPVSMYPTMAVSTAMSNTLNSGTSGATATTVSAYVMPMALDTPLIYNEIWIPVLQSATTTVTNTNWSYSQGVSLGLYTLTAGSLSLVSSYSHKALFSLGSNAVSGSASATLAMSWGGSATQNTTVLNISNTSATAASLWTAISGSKMLPLMTGSSQSLAENQYFAVVAATYLTAGSNLSQLASIGHVTQGGNLSHLQAMGYTSTGGTTGFHPLMGLMSFVQNTNTVWPLSLATANITTSSNNATFVNRSIFALFVMRTT